ncbi:argonaute/piwi family protein [Paraburkholderia bannensis]|uniref:argonaute/piwi family protein n=1 Tax=Paraburkholderia bannensis TaxID=765414 RepID=UPI002AB7594B|nr:Piwi domain-containing protein [Paraburkholderia bannensis]
MTRELLLNITPVRYKSGSFEVEVLPYETGNRLRALRHEHGQTHVFRRDRDKILCVPRAKDVPLLGGQRKELEFKENKKLVAALAQEALLSWFFSKKLLSRSFDPIEVIGKENLLEDFADIARVLGVRTRVTATTRQLQFDERSSFVGITWDVSTQRTVEVDCARLLELGLDLVGLYVERAEPSSDPRLLPRLQVAGRVEEIRNGIAYLSETREGPTESPLSELLLEPRFDAYDRCIETFGGRDAARIKEKLETRLALDRQGPERLAKVRRIVDWVRQSRLELLQGVPFEVGDMLCEDNPRRFPKVIQNPGPTYVFDASGNRTSTFAASGLAKHGPYSRQVFTPSSPRVCVICEKTRRGQVEAFLNKFVSGISVPGKNSPYPNGFARTYHLHSVQLQFFEASGPSAEAFHAAASEAVRAGAEARWDLALVQTSESTHQLSPAQNPYMVAKAVFLTSAITSQAFEIETTTMQPLNLAYTISNMALACYAKLNGTPWRISNNQGIAHEIVVGMGSAAIGEGRFGSKERVVGITSVFLSDGEYVLSNLSRAVPIQSYGDTLLHSLRETFNRLKEDMNWRPRDAVRIIVHAFKPMQDVQVDAMKAAIADLGDFDVEFAFLHVKEHHPVMLWDKREEGKWGKGKWTPRRGLTFQLTSYQYLLTVTGPSELKKTSDGVPRPLLVELHPSSTFRDMLYLTKQVLWFASHSWRSFLPAHMPVTILYSDQVAKLLGKLDKVYRWNPDSMLGRIGTTRWFL